MKGHVAADAVNKYSWDRPALAAPVTSLLGPSVSAPVSEYDQRLKAILGGVVPDRAAVCSPSCVDVQVPDGSGIGSASSLQRRVHPAMGTVLPGDHAAAAQDKVGGSR